MKPSKIEEPKCILRITVLGPLASDRSVIPIEMKVESALKFESATKLIEAKLKKAELRMTSQLYWIGKSKEVILLLVCSATIFYSFYTDCGIHRINLPSYCDWPWNLKHSNYNLFCECDKLENP